MHDEKRRMKSEGPVPEPIYRSAETPLPPFDPSTIPSFGHFKVQ
jgi:hypothetical protein